MNASERFDSLFRYYAERYGAPWTLLKAQAQAESGVQLDPGAASPVGASGLAQFMAATWREWADGTPGIQELPPHELLDPRNPEAAIRAQAAMMAWLLKRFAGDQKKALGAYNYGIGNMMRLLAAYHENWLNWAPMETRIYVARVMGYVANSPTTQGV